MWQKRETKVIEVAGPCVCVYYCRTYYKANESDSCGKCVCGNASGVVKTVFWGKITLLSVILESKMEGTELNTDSRKEYLPHRKGAKLQILRE